MIKSADMLVLLWLSDGRSRWTLREMAGETLLPLTTVTRSIARLSESRLYSRETERMDATLTLEFLIHSVKFLWPAKMSGEARGLSTAWGAPLLKEKFAPYSGLELVWPDPLGDVRGIAVEPIHPLASRVARSDRRMYDLLALVDGIRLGDARLRSISAELLDERVGCHEH